MPAAVPPASDAAEPSSLLSIVDRTAYDRLINSIAEELPEATGQKFRGASVGLAKGCAVLGRGSDCCACVCDVCGSGPSRF